MKMYNHQGVAAVLSTLLPGLGQVYNGQGKMALVYFVIHCGLIYGIGYSLYDAILKGYGFEAPLFLAIGAIANMIWSAIGAYNQALHHNALIEEEDTDN